jgi:hypothetical protein
MEVLVLETELLVVGTAVLAFVHKLLSLRHKSPFTSMRKVLAVRWK